MELKKAILDINVSDIVPNRFQPRIKFDENNINELANSIRKYGIISPLLLRQINDKYEIIAGERRYKAAMLLGLKTVPAMIAITDDAESAELALIENVQRKDLSSLEEAKSYDNLMSSENLTREQISSNISKNQAFVEGKLRLLELSDQTKQSLLDNLISEGHAKVLLKLKNKQREIEVLNKVINERLTVKETDEYIKSVNNDVEQNNFSQDTINLSDLNNKEEIQENINGALDNINLDNNSIVNVSSINVERDESMMNNENNNGGLNSFSMNNNENNKFFPSMEDQTVNMNTANQMPIETNNFGMTPDFSQQPNNNFGTPAMDQSSTFATPQQMNNSFESVSPMPEQPLNNSDFSNIQPVNNEFGGVSGMSGQPATFASSQQVNNGYGSVSPMPEQPLNSSDFSNIQPINNDFGGVNAMPGQTSTFVTPQQVNNGFESVSLMPEQPLNSPDFSNVQPINNEFDINLSSNPQNSVAMTDFGSPQSMNNNFGQVNFNNGAIDKIKATISELQANGFQIELQESDTPTDFELVIKIKK